MAANTYERFGQSELILRDELAIDRTLLANERTFLAYLRSAVALLITGLSIIHFSDTLWFFILGLACVPGSVLVLLVGLSRFQKMKHSILIVRNRLSDLRSEKDLHK